MIKKRTHKKQDNRQRAILKKTFIVFGMTLQMGHAMELEKDSGSCQYSQTTPFKKFEEEIHIEVLIRRSYGSSMLDKITFLTKYYNGFIPEFYMKDYDVNKYFNRSLSTCSVEDLQPLLPYELYLIYIKAEFDHWPKDFVKYIEDKAHKDDPFHQNLLGLMYGHGRGYSQDTRLSFEWYSKATALGLPEGYYNVGYSYECGIGVEKNLKNACVNYTIAATKGLAAAQLQLGSISYHEALSESNDFNSAFDWFYKAAEQGDPFAQFKIAQFYEEGKGVSVDLKTSTMWCLKAAEGGCHDAQWDLYGRYAGQLDGIVNEKEYKKWMKKAKQQGECSLNMSLHLGTRALRNVGIYADMVSSFIEEVKNDYNTSTQESFEEVKSKKHGSKVKYLFKFGKK